MKIRIRAARPADAEAIAAVHVATWQSAYRGIIPDETLDALSVEQRTQRWLDILNSGASGEFVFVAERDGDIVGFASGGPERTGGFTFPGELYAVYVHPAVQQRGIGRALVAAVAGSLQRIGFGAMIVWVLAANPACSFYEGLGGVEVDRKQIEIGGAELEEIAYGWEDISPLAPKQHDAS